MLLPSYGPAPTVYLDATSGRQHTPIANPQIRAHFCLILLLTAHLQRDTTPDIEWR